MGRRRSDQLFEHLFAYGEGHKGIIKPKQAARDIRASLDDVNYALREMAGIKIEGTPILERKGNEYRLSGPPQEPVKKSKKPALAKATPSPAKKDKKPYNRDTSPPSPEITTAPEPYVGRQDASAYRGNGGAAPVRQSRRRVSSPAEDIIDVDTDFADLEDGREPGAGTPDAYEMEEPDDDDLVLPEINDIKETADTLIASLGDNVHERAEIVSRFEREDVHAGDQRSGRLSISKARRLVENYFQKEDLIDYDELGEIGLSPDQIETLEADGILVREGSVGFSRGTGELAHNGIRQRTPSKLIGSAPANNTSTWTPLDIRAWRALSDSADNAKGGKKTPAVQNRSISEADEIAVVDYFFGRSDGIFHKASEAELVEAGFSRDKIKAYSRKQILSLSDGSYGISRQALRKHKPESLAAFDAAAAKPRVVPINYEVERARFIDYFTAIGLEGRKTAHADELLKAGFTQRELDEGVYKSGVLGLGNGKIYSLSEAVLQNLPVKQPASYSEKATA